MRALQGNSRDGHTLAETLEQVSILTDQIPKIAVVGKGYRGVEIEDIQILRSGQRRGITKSLRALIHRRSPIEPFISHMKSEGRLQRNPFKGELGNNLPAVLCGTGQNIRWLLCIQILRWLLALYGPLTLNEFVVA